MRYFVLLFMPLLMLGCSHNQNPGQTITASTDSNEKLHPAQLQLSRAAMVTCLSASGKNGSAGKCNINGTSVAPPNNVTATDKVYLLCEGTPPSTCSAKVQ